MPESSAWTIWSYTLIMPFAVLALLFAAACGPGRSEPLPPETSVTQKPIEQVLQEHTDRLLAVPGVVGTAQGECDGEPCIKVFVVDKTAELSGLIPSSLEGYQVDAQVTGEIRARGAP